MVAKKEHPVDAWRCEECHKWHSSKEDVHVLVVLDVGPDSDTGDHLERAYVPRVMHVCGDCKAEMTDEKVGFGEP